MKTARDPRHIERVKVMQELFAWDFDTDEKVEIVPERVEKTKEIILHISTIDPEIVEAAPEWPLAKINKVDLSVLRQAVYELLVQKNVPIKVVVDEAVEIAKEYGTDSSPLFINGVLGKIISKHKIG